MKYYMIVAWGDHYKYLKQGWKVKHARNKVRARNSGTRTILEKKK